MSAPPRTPACAAGERAQLSGRARARRDAILAAGRELFLEKGYSATSLADVVKRSGGSLATVYELFGSKRGLFEAILVEYAEEILQPLCTENVAPDPERGLTVVGRRYLESALSPQAVAWYRAVIQEAPHVPELRETFLSADGGPVQRAVARYLEELTRAGLLAIDDAALAAGQFLDLVRGRLHRCALAGEAAALSRQQIDRQVANAVRVFLHGYAATAPIPSPSTRSRGAGALPLSSSRGAKVAPRSRRLS